MRDGQTNKQTREDIATQSMDTGKLSFRNMSNPYLWMIWKYSEIYMKYMKLLREIDVPFALGTSLWQFTWRQNQCQKCTGLLLSIAMDFDMIHSNPKNQLCFRASGWRRRCAGSWRQRETAGSREQSRRHEGILPGRCVARPRHSSRNPMKQEFGQRWIFLRRGTSLFCVGINVEKDW